MPIRDLISLFEALKQESSNPRAPAGAAYLSRRRVDNHRVNFPDKSVGEHDSTRLKAYRSKVVITALRVFPRTPHLSPHEHLATRESIPRRTYASLSIEAKWSSSVTNQCIPTPRTRAEVRNGYGKRAGGLLPPNDRQADGQKEGKMERKEGREGTLLNAQRPCWGRLEGPFKTVVRQSGKNRQTRVTILGV